MTPLYFMPLTSIWPWRPQRRTRIRYSRPPCLGEDLRHVARQGREGPGDALPVRLVAPRALGVDLGAVGLGQGQAAKKEENR
jgi:hypothetical protein